MDSNWNLDKFWPRHCTDWPFHPLFSACWQPMKVPVVHSMYLQVRVCLCTQVVQHAHCGNSTWWREKVTVIIWWRRRQCVTAQKMLLKDSNCSRKIISTMKGLSGGKNNLDSRIWPTEKTDESWIPRENYMFIKSSAAERKWKYFCEEIMTSWWKGGRVSYSWELPHLFVWRFVWCYP